MTPRDFTLDDEALANCSAEPIHIPGSIQPFGLLFALDGDGAAVSELRIAQHSANAAEFLDAGSSTLIGRPIGSLLALDGFGAIASADFPAGEPARVTTHAAGRDHHWLAFLHRHRGRVILELERDDEADRVPGASLPILREGLAGVDAAGSVTELCQRACETIRALTGLDGVMAYRFHEDEHGEVIAEAKDPRFPPYLGLHYPASDIPRQARAMFLDTWVRMIPDRDYRPVPMIGAENAEPLDMGLAMLRSVSPVHIEYLRNMGVYASLTLSIIREGKLWGLFAGHHYSAPRHVPYEARAASETVARITSALLPAKSMLEQQGQRERARRVHAQLIEQMREAEDIATGLTKGAVTLQDLVDCEGAAALADDGQWLAVGTTPAPEQIARLAEWIEAHSGAAETFETDALGRLVADAAELRDVAELREVASGVLAARIPKGRGNYLLWFKPEVVQTVRWAGDPHKPVNVNGGAARLHPRNSFDEWRQAVRGQSTRWTSADVDAAIELLHAAAGVDLQRQFEREQEARARAEWASEQKEQLLAMVSHDLRDPLQSLKLNALLLERLPELSDKATLVLGGMGRSLERMNRLINDLLSISKLEYGNLALEIDEHAVTDLLHDVQELLLPIAREKGVRMEVGPAEGRVRCDRDRVLQVLSNLVSNAVKFTPSGGLIEIRAQATPGGTRISVRDTGPGIPPEDQESIFDRFWQARRHHRLGVGLGLTIAKSIVEAHDGRIWVESTPGEGSTFHFTLAPAA